MRLQLTVAIIGLCAVACTSQASAPSSQSTAVSAAAASGATAVTVSSGGLEFAGIALHEDDIVLTLRNAGSNAVDVSGWRLRNGAQEASLPANSRIAPDATLAIHTATGTNTDSAVYLGTSGAALSTALRSGGTVELLD